MKAREIEKMNLVLREAIINGGSFCISYPGCYLNISKSRGLQMVAKSNGNCFLKANENTTNCIEIHFHTNEARIQIWK